MTEPWIDLSEEKTSAGADGASGISREIVSGVATGRIFCAAGKEVASYICYWHKLCSALTECWFRRLTEDDSDGG